MNLFTKDAYGNVIGDENVYRYDYNAYGNLTAQWTDGKAITQSYNDENPFLYCGEYFDEESGLIYLRNRYYDPSIGRFINEDPIRDGINWYAYCANNPVMFVDPYGLNAIFITDVDAVGGFGHTSVIIQDDYDDWYYCYWGSSEAICIYLYPEEVYSLETLNYALHQDYMGEAKYKGDYDYYVTVQGDFSDGLQYYANIINKADTVGNNKNNKNYNVLYNNCTQTSTIAMAYGILPDGKSFSEYLSSNNLIPVVQFYNVLSAAGKSGYGFWGKR